MTRFVAMALLFACNVVYGIDSNEFHLYGVTEKGVVFDIRPYGDRTSAIGDVNEPAGIHGEFYSWFASPASGSFSPIGTCRVRQARKYRFSCAKGNRPFSGVTYYGKPVSKSQLNRQPIANALYRNFIETHEYGELAAIYRCRIECDSNVPPYLIFVWRGD